MGKEGGHTLRKLVASFSVATKTPIPYWLSLPVAELLEWTEPIQEVTAKRG